MSDDAATVAKTSELDSCSADSPSSVIGPDHTSSVETSAQAAPSDDSNVIVSAASDDDAVVQSAATDPGAASQSELISSSPLKLVIDIDTSFVASDQCDVHDDAVAEIVESIDIDTIALCETVDETGCDDVVSESLPVSSDDVPVTFPSPSTELATSGTSGDDSNPGSGLQSVADSADIGDAAD